MVAKFKTFFKEVLMFLIIPFRPKEDIEEYAETRPLRGKVVKILAWILPPILTIGQVVCALPCAGRKAICNFFGSIFQKKVVAAA